MSQPEEAAKVDTSRGNIDFVQNAIRGAWHEMEGLPLQTSELLVALMDERENLNDQMDEHLKQWGLCVEENKRLLADNDRLRKLCEEVASLRLGPNGYCSFPLNDLVDRARAELSRRNPNG